MDGGNVIDVPDWLGPALVVFFVLSGAYVAAQARRRPAAAPKVGDTDRPLYGIWLILAGAIGLLVATVVFCACSIDGYDGDPGPVVATVFDIGLWGGMTAMLAGAAWGVFADILLDRTQLPPGSGR